MKKLNYVLGLSLLVTVLYEGAYGSSGISSSAPPTSDEGKATWPRISSSAPTTEDEINKARARVFSFEVSLLSQSMETVVGSDFPEDIRKALAAETEYLTNFANSLADSLGHSTGTKEEVSSLLEQIQLARNKLDAVSKPADYYAPSKETPKNMGPKRMYHIEFQYRLMSEKFMLPNLLKKTIWVDKNIKNQIEQIHKSKKEGKLPFDLNHSFLVLEFNVLNKKSY